MSISATRQSSSLLPQPGDRPHQLFQTDPQQQQQASSLSIHDQSPNFPSYNTIPGTQTICSPNNGILLSRLLH